MVAPAFVLGFAFIYGLMVWNGVLSFSASRMLPNYEWVGLAQYEKAVDHGSLVGGAQEPGHFGVGYGVARWPSVCCWPCCWTRRSARGCAAHHLPVPHGLVVCGDGHRLKWLLNPGLGIEKMVRDWGFPNFEFGWLVDTDMAIYCVVIAGIWQSAGFAMALFSGRAARH